MPGINFGGLDGSMVFQSDDPVSVKILFASAVVATPVELLPAGSLTRGITILWNISSGSGSVGNGGATYVNKPAVGTSTVVVTIQVGDTYTFSVSDTGNLTVHRSAGTFSSQVSVLLLYA